MVQPLRKGLRHQLMTLLIFAKMWRVLLWIGPQSMMARRAFMTLEHRGVVVKELRLSPPLKPCLVLSKHLHFALSENRIGEAKLDFFLAAANPVYEKKLRLCI